MEEITSSKYLLFSCHFFSINNKLKLLITSLEKNYYLIQFVKLPI